MANIPKKPRLIFRVVPSPGTKLPWCLVDFKRARKPFKFKKDAVSEGRSICKALYGTGNLTQLVVSRADGTIEYEHTYGNDPRRFKG